MEGQTFTEAFKGVKGGDKLVLKTAAGIFAQKGYHQTTVEEIARTLGVSKGTIYYHFKNKEDLYLSIIREGINLLQKSLRRAVDDSATPRDKIKNLIQSHLAFYEKEKDMVFLFMKELCGADLQREVLVKMLSGCLQIIGDTVEEGIKDGVFRDIDREITTVSLFGMITVSALHYIVHSKKIPHGQIGAAIEQILFQGLLKTGQ